MITVDILPPNFRALSTRDLSTLLEIRLEYLNYFRSNVTLKYLTLAVKHTQYHQMVVSVGIHSGNKEKNYIAHEEGTRQMLNFK